MRFQRRRSLKTVYEQRTGQEMTLTQINHILSLVVLYLTLFRSQAAIAFKISIIFTFSHVKAYVSKIDLVVEQVKVILGSSFYQTMMGCSPKCYIPNFVKIGLPAQEKKILSVFYHIWAWRPSWSCDLDFAIKLSLPIPMNAAHKISL